MGRYKNGYLTRAALTTEIKKVVAEKHGITTKQIFIDWLCNWQLVTFPTGLVAKTGKISLQAIGFNTRTYCVFQDKNKRWYMR